MLARTSIVAILLFLLAGAGCVQPIIVNAFPGPDRPDDQVTTLEVDAHVRLTSLDGAPIPGLPAGLTEHDSQAPRIVCLLPGTHEIVAGIWPRIEVHSYPVYSHVYHGGGGGGGGDCRGGGGHFAYVVTHYQSTTTHVPGSRDDERLEFTVTAGRHYRLALDDPLNWFSRRQRWSAQVIERTAARKDPVVSTTRGRQAHVTLAVSLGISRLPGNSRSPLQLVALRFMM